MENNKLTFEERQYNHAIDKKVRHLMIEQKIALDTDDYHEANRLEEAMERLEENKIVKSSVYGRA